MDAEDTDALLRKLAAAPAVSPARVLREGTHVGHYEVLARLGAGGMGVVYRARDLRLGREVALKFLTETRLDDHSRARFHREARLASAVSHPNVVALHDVGEHNGIPYLVTELLRGQTLRELISAGPVPWQKAVSLVEQVAEGLAAAHAKGIIHRDLKPENLILTDAGHLKILDFGVARLEEPEPPGDGSDVSLTKSGTTVGTPAYMSPEQVRTEPVDARSDLFSLGCVLYELLAGKRPFSGQTVFLHGYAVCHKEPEPLPPQTPPQVAAVVLRCLQKQPRDRFQTARELAAVLRALQGSRELSAPRRRSPRQDARCPIRASRLGR